MSVPFPASTDDEVELTASKRLPVLVNDIGFTTLYSPKSDPVADVVFVHGLHGNPRKTWRYRGTDIVREPVAEDAYVKKGLGPFRKKRPKWEEKRIKRLVYWPADLLPDDQNDIRIMTYGYDSHVIKFFKGAANQTNISGHGRSFLNSLAAERLTCPHRPLIFVAHSLGGLVVKEALRRSRDERHQSHLQNVYQSTYATIFLGTPHRGSTDAGWGEVLRRIASAAQFDTAKPILADVEIYSKEHFLVTIIGSTLESAHVHVVGIDKFLGFIFPLVKRRGFFGNNLVDYKFSPAIYRQTLCTKLFRNPMLALP